MEHIFIQKRVKKIPTFFKSRQPKINRVGQIGLGPTKIKHTSAISIEKFLTVNSTSMNRIMLSQNDSILNACFRKLFVLHILQKMICLYNTPNAIQRKHILFFPYNKGSQKHHPNKSIF